MLLLLITHKHYNFFIQLIFVLTTTSFVLLRNKVLIKYITKWFTKKIIVKQLYYVFKSHYISYLNSNIIESYS